MGVNQTKIQLLLSHWGRAFCTAIAASRSFLCWHRNPTGHQSAAADCDHRRRDGLLVRADRACAAHTGEQKSECMYACAHALMCLCTLSCVRTCACVVYPRCGTPRRHGGFGGWMLIDARHLAAGGHSTGPCWRTRWRIRRTGWQGSVLLSAVGKAGYSQGRIILCMGWSITRGDAVGHPDGWEAMLHAIGHTIGHRPCCRP